MLHGNTGHHGNRIPLGGVFLAKKRCSVLMVSYCGAGRFMEGQVRAFFGALHNLIRLIQKPVTGHVVLYLAHQKSTIIPIAEDTSPASSAGPAPPTPPHTPHKVNFD